jgi:hypothetical protein
MASYGMMLSLVVTLAVLALVVLLAAVIVRAAAAGARVGDRSAWSTRPPASGEPEEPAEPVIEVTPEPPRDDLAKMIEENNRLLRQILEELRRRPPEPPGGRTGHLG